MEWLIFGLIAMGVIGAFTKGAEQNKAKAEAEQRKARAEAAREAIIKSGNPELIQRLHLLEATRETGSAKAATSSGGSDVLRTAAGVAGGLIVADAITTQMQLSALESAFADIETDISAGLAEASGDVGDILDFEI